MLAIDSLSSDPMGANILPIEVYLYTVKVCIYILNLIKWRERYRISFIMTFSPISTSTCITPVNPKLSTYTIKVNFQIASLRPITVQTFFCKF